MLANFHQSIPNLFKYFEFPRNRISFPKNSPHPMKINEFLPHLLNFFECYRIFLTSIAFRPPVFWYASYSTVALPLWWHSRYSILPFLGFPYIPRKVKVYPTRSRSRGSRPKIHQIRTVSERMRAKRSPACGRENWAVYSVYYFVPKGARSGRRFFAFISQNDWAWPIWFSHKKSANLEHIHLRNLRLKISIFWQI